jgi:uncharacterized flavoprotein (TIGR03862 family)
VGAGSCGLFLSNLIDTEQYEVEVYEKNRTAGKKFLVAGHGGLNLTHSEDPDTFIKRYHPAGFLDEAFSKFSNLEFMTWLTSIGIPVMTGSSGRVFPAGKPKPVNILNLLLERAKGRGVMFYFEHTWTGFKKGTVLKFRHADGEIEKQFHYAVLCLGGASWPVTGSTGEWRDDFEKNGIETFPFSPSNCTFLIDWPDGIKKLAGRPLKNISITAGDTTICGEVTITSAGIEGSGIYPFSPFIRSQLVSGKHCILSVDLKPGVSAATIAGRIAARKRNQSVSDHLRKDLKFSGEKLQLIRSYSGKDQFNDPVALSQLCKALPLSIKGCGPLEDAISTVGGIPLAAIDPNFSLRKMPRVHVLGEMLDYDAPTGGYLLQSCYTMSAWLAAYLNQL